MSSPLNCLACSNRFLQKINLCKKGHSVCAGCSETVMACPICKEPMTGGRNYALEAIIEQLPAPVEPEIEKSNCVLCREHPSPTGNIQQLLQHYESHVKKLRVFGSYFTYHQLFKKAERVEYDHMILKWNNKLFKFCVQVDHDGGNAYFALQMFGCNSSKKYLFVINYMRGPQRNKFVGSVNRVSLDEETYSSGCVTIPIIEFSQLVSLNIKLTCCIRDDTPNLRKLLTN